MEGRIRTSAERFLQVNIRVRRSSFYMKLIRVYLSSRCTFKYIRCASHRSRTRVEWEHIPRVERLHQVQYITYVSW